MVEQPTMPGWVSHWSLTVPLPDNVADRPDLRWANVKGEQGFVFDWPTIHNLLGRVGSDTAWSWVRFDELKTGAWIRVSGRARQFAVEIGDPGHDTSRLAVYHDSDQSPRRDIGTHGWILLAAVGELLDLVDAYLTCRAWFQRGAIPNGIVLRSMQGRRM
jgi:hypothetical protein